MSRRLLASLVGGFAAVIVAALLSGSPSAPVAVAESVKGALSSRPRAESPPVKPLAAGTEIRTTAGERRREALPDGSVLYANEQTVAKLTANNKLAV